MSGTLSLVRKGKREEYTYAPENYPGWTVIETGIAADDPRVEAVDEHAKAVAEIEGMGSHGRYQKLLNEIKELRARLEKLEGRA